LTLFGTLRFGGYVDVAGLVSVSIEVYIALEYDDQRKVLSGAGRLSISVHILFFSLRRDFLVSRRIAGFGEPPAEVLGAIAPLSPALPSFANTMSGLQWESYCRAFA
jgi:hypothetical protein